MTTFDEISGLDSTTIHKKKNIGRKVLLTCFAATAGSLKILTCKIHEIYSSQRIHTSATPTPNVASSLLVFPCPTHRYRLLILYVYNINI